ncbi:PepSY-associated TM helix domain-containing protein [Frateuria aurantia]
MKLRSSTLRIYQQVHTWTGLLAGFALFVAFYAGALSVFRSDIDLWQSPPWQASRTPTLSAQQLVERLVRDVPEARADFGLMLPDGGSPPYLFWFGAGKVHYLTAQSDAHPSDHAPPDRLADFIYTLHYSLGASAPGMYLMGVVSLLYGLALVSGVIIHLPGLVQQLFALRPGNNIKRLWNDAHNAIGVLSLPFHIMFALTGALFCLLGVAMPLLGKVALGPDLASRYAQAVSATVIQPNTVNHQPASTLSVEALLQRARAEAARAGSAGIRPDYVHFVDYAQTDGHAEVSGICQHTIATYCSIDLSAHDGHVLAATLGRHARLNNNLTSAMYGLHFANYGGRAVQWLYFALGLGGAFLFYSGNLLWLESRRKRRHQQQPRRVRFMARATLGVCLGSCLGISVCFAATGLSGVLGHSPGSIAQTSFFATLLAACMFASFRPVPAVSYALCMATGWVSALTGALHLLYSLPRLGSNPGPAPVSVLMVDLVGLALGVGFFGLARASRRRGLHGDPHSIWAVQRPEH